MTLPTKRRIVEKMIELFVFLTTKSSNKKMKAKHQQEDINLPLLSNKYLFEVLISNLDLLELSQRKRTYKQKCELK